MRVQISPGVLNNEYLHIYSTPFRLCYGVFMADPSISEAEIAWAAGLFEGEGCISPWKNKRGAIQSLHLNLSMTDEDVVKRFWKIIGCGSFNGPYIKVTIPGSKPLWQCRVSNFEDSVEILNIFLPFLGARRTQRAKECIDLVTEARTKLEPRGNKKICANGHLRSEHSYIRKSTGSTICRACQSVHNRKNRIKREEKRIKNANTTTR